MKLLTQLGDAAFALGELERLATYKQVSDGTLPITAGRPLYPHERRAGVDFKIIDQVMTAGYSATAVAVQSYVDALQASLAEAMRGVNDPRALATKTSAWVADPPAAVTAAYDAAVVGLHAALDETCRAAGLQVLQEARAQGVRVMVAEPAAPRVSLLSEARLPVLWVQSKVVQTIFGVGVRATDGTDVVRMVGEVKIAQALDLARQSVHVAHGEGRIATMRLLAKQGRTVLMSDPDATPETGGVEAAEIYASELLDSSTCSPCLNVDGTSYSSMTEAEIDYPGAGPYAHCLGGARCRGTLIVVWADEAAPSVRDDDHVPADLIPPAPPPAPELPAGDRRPLGGSFAPKPAPVGEVRQLTGSFAPKPAPKIVPPAEPAPLPATGPKWKVGPNGQLVPNTPTAAPVVTAPTAPAVAKPPPAAKPAPAPARDQATVKGFKNRDAAKTWASKVWPQAEGYPPAQVKAIEDYTALSFEKTNATLRRTQGKSGAMRNLDAAFTRAPRVPEDIQVIRGASARQFGFGKGDDISGIEGKTFTEHGYWSTSLAREGILDNDVVMNIRVPKGHKALYVSGPPKPPPKALSGVGGAEVELILPRSSQFIVHSAIRKGKKWIVDAEIIPS